jgi:hypothetical protein
MNYLYGFVMLLSLALTGILTISLSMGLPVAYGLSGIALSIAVGFWAACRVED